MGITCDAKLSNPPFPVLIILHIFRPLFEPTCAGAEAGHHETVRPYDVIPGRNYRWASVVHVYWMKINEAGVSVGRPANRIPLMGFSLSLTVRVTHSGGVLTLSVTLEAWKDAPVNKALDVLIYAVLCYCGAHEMTSSFHCWILQCYWDLRSV